MVGRPHSTGQANEILPPEDEHEILLRQQCTVVRAQTVDVALVRALPGPQATNAIGKFVKPTSAMH